MMNNMIKLPQQNTFYFEEMIDNNNNNKQNIIFDSVFDSGNCQNVIKVATNTFMIYTAHDCAGTGNDGYPKSWFYFSVQGFKPKTEVTFIIRRIQILWSLYKVANDSYKPVIRIGNGSWHRLKGKSELSENKDDNQLEVTFSYKFMNDPNEKVYIAFSYPFSYTECQNLIKNLCELYQNDQDIYFNHEVIIKSPQDRNIDLLTISSHEGKQNLQESYINEWLFPDRDKYQRAIKFRANKPIILITARVHPGETPSSHTMNGILNFILDKSDIRAHLLRRFFVIILIPMINPDGVYNGYYRMDYHNQNLNRYYKNPERVKQPMIYAIKELVEYLNSESRLFFYCDLHAHAARKGCFLYGNALDFIRQVESMLFAKVMSMNCINFDYTNCNFSLKHMNSRDKGEVLTKEGAGRVSIYRICNIIHSYTLECGFHYTTQLNKISEPQKIIKGGSPFRSAFECKEDEISDINSMIYKETPTYCTIKIYENIGKSLMISILDIFEKNPCSRIGTSVYKTLSVIRKEIAGGLSKDSRFRGDLQMRKKLRDIEEYSKQIFYDYFIQRNVFQDAKPPIKPISLEKKIFYQSKLADDFKNKLKLNYRARYTGNSRLPINDTKQKAISLESNHGSDNEEDNNSDIIKSAERNLDRNIVQKSQMNTRKDKSPINEGFLIPIKEKQDVNIGGILTKTQHNKSVIRSEAFDNPMIYYNQVCLSESKQFDLSTSRREKEKSREREYLRQSFEDKIIQKMLSSSSSSKRKINEDFMYGKNRLRDGYSIGYESKIHLKSLDRDRSRSRNEKILEQIEKIDWNIERINGEKAKNAFMKLPIINTKTPNCNQITMNFQPGFTGSKLNTREYD